jgi:hypothetical protein
MHRDQWDVIANGRPDALWYAVQLALRIAVVNPGKVRLFTDRVKELAAAVPGIDAGGMGQRWNDIKLLDHRLARIARPARTILLIFDSDLPENYVRLMKERDQSPIALRLLRLDEQPRPDALYAGDIEFPVQCVNQGDDELSLGLVRPVEVHRPTAPWEPEALSDAGRPEERTIVIDAEADGTWRNWLAALSTSPAPVRLIVLPCGAREEILTVLPALRVDARDVKLGSLRVSLTPQPCPWSTIDALLLQVDLVFTSREDVVMRAALRGTPAAYSGWQPMSADAGSSMRAERSPLVHRLRSVAAMLSDAWRGSRPMGPAWLEFCHSWPRALDDARSTSTLMTALPSLANCIIEHSHRALCAPRATQSTSDGTRIEVEEGSVGPTHANHNIEWVETQRWQHTGFEATWPMGLEAPSVTTPREALEGQAGSIERKG